MGPICGLMVFLVATDTPDWMKWSAGAVVLFTVAALWRGYGRRLVLTPAGASLVRLVGSLEIPWERVRRVGVYIPGGGVGATEYVFITTRATAPDGKWDLDGETIQLQNRPGLIEAIEAARREWGGKG